MSFVSVDGIRKAYGQGSTRVQVLKGISFGMEKGEICVLLGASGSGKSTLLNIIGGIETADEGTVCIDGDVLGRMREAQLSEYRRRHLGYIFQSYNLIANLTVRENIEVGAYLGEHPLDLDDMIRTLGLWEHQDKLPNQISGGQQQRTAIGRAIVKNPGLLLCDEPTGALDSVTSGEILQLIETVRDTYQTTILLVTHNEEIRRMADRVITLRDGSIRSDQENTERISASELQF